MARIIRVTLTNGETRLQGIKEGVTMQEWWRTVRADGAVIGEVWCARFEAISHADLIIVKDELIENSTDANKLFPPLPYPVRMPGMPNSGHRNE